MPEHSSRVALVTAGSGGIGHAIAQALVADGCRVVITGRSAEKGERAAGEIGATFMPADALDQQQTEGVVDRVCETFGGLDILVNNAGGSGGAAPVHELSDAVWMQAFNWNVSSAFWTVRRAVPGMLAKGFGRIINISSMQGKQANRPNGSHYIMAKHALNGFTKAVALEYGRLGVTCNAICVGPVETEMMLSAGPAAAAADGLTYEQFKERYASASMLGRFNTASEVAAMARLLASDAGGGVTGSILNVDGGTCPY